MTSFRYVWLFLGSTYVFTAAVQVAVADELRVVDQSGLVRAVKTVKGVSAIEIELEALTAQTTKECLLSNVDGLAAERTAPVDRNRKCLFESVPAMTWQVDSPLKGGRYQVRVKE